jgi:hypothetical protein
MRRPSKNALTGSPVTEDVPTRVRNSPAQVLADDCCVLYFLCAKRHRSLTAYTTQDASALAFADVRSTSQGPGRTIFQYPERVELLAVDPGDREIW